MSLKIVSLKLLISSNQVLVKKSNVNLITKSYITFLTFISISYSVWYVHKSIVWKHHYLNITIKTSKTLLSIVINQKSLRIYTFFLVIKCKLLKFMDKTANQELKCQCNHLPCHYYKKKAFVEMLKEFCIHHLHKAQA